MEKKIFRNEKAFVSYLYDETGYEHHDCDYDCDFGSEFEEFYSACEMEMQQLVETKRERLEAAERLDYLDNRDADEMGVHR